MQLQNPKYIYNLDGRAGAAAGYIEFTLANFVARNNIIDLDMPPGSELVDGKLNVVDAFDAATTDTIKVGDLLDDDRYLAAASVKAAGLVPLVPTGYIFTPDNHTLRVTRVATGTAATKGTVRIYFRYAEINKADWPQGDQGAGYYPT